MSKQALTTVSIAGTDVQRVIYRGEPVVTFAQVDRVHGRADGTAGRNFRENRERFVEGEDFIEVGPDEIRRDLQGVFSKYAPSGILLTRRGYLKLVKPMNDDRAWAVQGEMIDRYFLVEEIGKENARRIAADAREARLQFKQHLAIAKLVGLTGNQAVLAANKATVEAVGFDVLAAMGVTHLAAPQNEALLTPTDIGNRIGGMSAREVNMALIEHGYQAAFRDAHGAMYYEPTEKGVAAGGTMMDTGKRHGNGTPIRQLKWSSRIVDMLLDDLTRAAA